MFKFKIVQRKIKIILQTDLLDILFISISNDWEQ